MSSIKQQNNNYLKLITRDGLSLLRYIRPASFGFLSMLRRCARWFRVGGVECESVEGIKGPVTGFLSHNKLTGNSKMSPELMVLMLSYLANLANKLL